MSSCKSKGTLQQDPKGTTPRIGVQVAYPNTDKKLKKQQQDFQITSEWKRHTHTLRLPEFRIPSLVNFYRFYPWKFTKDWIQRDEPPSCLAASIGAT